MTSKQNWLVHDHSQYEDTLSRCQEAVEIEDWETAISVFQELITNLKIHITQEEEVVFPVYDAMVEISHDPTKALRNEHDRIISFMQDMQQVIKSHDSEIVLESLDRLENLMMKHHEKEEDIFLPMAGYVLYEDREKIMEKLRTFNTRK